MKVTVEHKTEVIGKKEYQLRITREIGLQEIVLNGKPTMIEAATYTEWPGNMGTSRTYTVARPEKTTVEEAAHLARVREIATQCLIAQGIW